MADTFRVLTSPVRVTGGLHVAQLVTLVTADAIVSAANDAGLTTEWAAAVLTGDLASQLAVEQELSREALDRDAVDRDDFIVRSRALEAAARDTAQETLAAFGVDTELSEGALDAHLVAIAARTAFVRLYEAGLLIHEQRVVNGCPRCGTVVDIVDAESGMAPAERLALRLIASNGIEIDVGFVCTELLPGVVAIAVPADHPAAGETVDVPLGAAVPVVADADRSEPAFVIPGHDQNDLDSGRRLGLAPIVVLDGTGTVTASGPLEGLSRYAARAAATDLLLGEGVVVDTEAVEEAVLRCRRCGTVVVPRLGRHWFLPMSDLEVLVADAVRDSVITVAPGSGRDELIAAVGQRGDWCVSQQVWVGQPVPVATCADCGQTDVSVEPLASCRKCMGQLVADDDVLDARFVGAVWPLATAGWPQDEPSLPEIASRTLLVIAPTGLVLWAVRMAALGLKLAGAPPFTRVAVHAAVDPLLSLEAVDDNDDAVRALVDDARADAAHLAHELLG